MNMIKSTVVFVFLLLVAGCVTHTQEAPTPIPEPPPSVGSTHQTDATEVILSGNRLSKDLTVGNQSMNVVGSLKRAGFTLSNQSRNLYHLEYKVEWLDQYGRQVSSGVWQRFQLSPNSRKDITSVSKTQDAEKFLATIRLPDDELLNGKHLHDSSLND